MTVPTPAPDHDAHDVAGKLTRRADEHVREHLWNGPALRVDGQPFVPLDAEETAAAGSDEFDVILRGPDGALYDVRIDITVTPRGDQ